MPTRLRFLHDSSRIAVYHTGMVLKGHAHFYEEIFAIPGFLGAPILCFGVQDIDANVALDGKLFPTLNQYFASLGLSSVSLDPFDPRAELGFDMNRPLPPSEQERYKCLIDIGCLEHVFDTRQCIENCLRTLAVGGYYLLHTPVNGYFNHGFHVFNPECLIAAFEGNGFHIVYQKFSTMGGETIQDPSHGDVVGWFVAQKDRPLGEFVPPQQGKWRTRYI